MINNQAALSLIKAIRYLLFVLIIIGFFIPTFAQKSDTLVSQPLSADSLTPFEAYPSRDKINFSNLKDTVSISFLKYKTEVAENLNFFNLVTIRNHFDKPIKVESEFLLPEGWTFFGSAKKDFEIGPNDSLIMPIRLGVSKSVLGGGAYPIQLLLNVGKIKYQGSFFIYKTEQSDFQFSVDQRVVLVNAITKTGEFKVNLKNKGNVNEYIKLNFKIGKQVNLIGLASDSDFAYIPLPAGADTIITYKVWYRETKNSNSYLNNLTDNSSIIISAYSKEKLKQASVWCKFVPHKFERDFYSITSPLNVALFVNGLLSDANSTFRVDVNGAFNFENGDFLSYFLSNFNASFNRDLNPPPGEYFRRNVIFSVGYQRKKLFLNIGDRNSIRGVPLTGRGITGIYSFNKNNVLTGSIVQNNFNRNFGGGIHLRTKIGPLPNTTIYGGILQNEVTQSNLRRVGISSSIPLKVISLGFGVNYNDHRYTVGSPGGQQTINSLGYSISSGYNGQRFGINGGYSYTPFFSINGAENNNIFVNSQYKFSPNNMLKLSVNGQNVTYGDITDQNSFYNVTSFYIGRLYYSTKIKNTIPLTIGPEYQYNLRTNNLLTFGNEKSFVGATYRFVTMATFKLTSAKSITAFIRPGYSFAEVNDNFYLIDSTSNISSNGLFNYNLGATYSNSNIFRISATYFYGPFFYFDQIDALGSTRINKNLRISPVFTKSYQFDNYTFRVSSVNSAILSISERSEKISLGVTADIITKTGWSFSAFANSYISSRQDEELSRTSYRTYSLNLVARKSFLFERKNQKYVNLTAICFEDINGNRTREENEPYISNILIKVRKDPNATGYNDINFQEKELLTNINGLIQYNRISSGGYILDINPVVNLGDIFPVNGYSQTIDIQNNTTIYVPFVETYKVKGEVKVIYDKFSKDQNFNVGGVRVTAKSEKGDLFYALTDKTGGFVISIPSSGYYTVSINNIFGEEYILQNNDVLVDFNGYKEFEVNFILKQKPRTLNMNGSGYQFKFNEDKNKEEKEATTPLTENNSEPKAKAQSTKSTLDKEAEKKLWEKTDDLQKQIDELRNLKEELQDIQTQQKQTLEEINQAKEEFEKVKEETQKMQEQQKEQNVEPPAQTPPTNTPVNTDNSNLDELDDLIDQLIEKTNPTVNYRVEFGVFKEKMPINFLNQLIKFGNVEVSDGDGGESRFVSKPYYSKKEAEDYANYLKQQNIGEIRLVGEKDGKEVSVEEVDQLLNR